MKAKYFLFVITSIVSFSPAFTQNYSSCETGLEICSKESLKFEFNRNTTNAHDLEIGKCLASDYPTTWVKFEIIEDGVFSFTITPETYAEDIDFAVYKLSETNDCNNKTLVRCMQCGMNLGDVKSSIPCLGPTGLSIKEPSYEVRGEQGCQQGTNNFLAALNCKKGERYALAIQNYDNSAAGFFIDFCGDAKLPCDSTTCLEFYGKGKFRKNSELAIIPESTSDDSLAITIFISELLPIVIDIKDENQKQVKYTSIFPKEKKENYAINIADLPNNEYNLEMKIGKRKAKGKFKIDRKFKH